MNEPTRADALAAGTDVGAYRIVKRIGVGGTGAVYEALHRRLDKRVALKTLLDAYRQSEEARRRFVNEGIAASRIRHPHVVDITDVGEARDVPYLVMELLEGETLGHYARRLGALTPTTIASVMIPVAAALSEAHRLGVIHRDLKPENVFLTRSQQGVLHPKVLDFGISKVLDRVEAGLTADEAFLGTPSYASPEQIENGSGVEAASDQYSFGVVLYELATGAPPFRGYTSLYQLLRAISSGDCPPPSIQRADIAGDLERVILRAMSVSPSSRFESMRELGRALLPFADDTTRTLWAPFFEPFDQDATQLSIAPPSPEKKPAETRAAAHADEHPSSDRAEDTQRSHETRVAVPTPARPARRVSRSATAPSASPQTPQTAVQSLRARERDPEVGRRSDATPPRWLGWAAVAALVGLGVASLYSSRRPPSELKDARQRVEALSVRQASAEPTTANDATDAPASTRADDLGLGPAIDAKPPTSGATEPAPATAAAPEPEVESEASPPRGPSPVERPGAAPDAPGGSPVRSSRPGREAPATRTPRRGRSTSPGPRAKGHPAPVEPVEPTSGPPATPAETPKDEKTSEILRTSDNLDPWR